METAGGSGRADLLALDPQTWRDGAIVLVHQKLYALFGSTSVDFSGRAGEDPIHCGRGVPSLYCAYNVLAFQSRLWKIFRPPKLNDALENVCKVMLCAVI